MKSNPMTYKGYMANIYYDKDDEIFVGEIFGINDSLSFHGKSVDELKEAFKNCIDDYLELCKEIGKTPDKEFSGSFNVRTSPSLHEKAAMYAFENNISLNQVISKAVEMFLTKEPGI